MRRRRHRRRRAQEEVTLNLAAMLDMAFQLLAFFILTFRPSPVEGQLSLMLPPPQPVTNVAAAPEESEDSGTGFSATKSLMITVMSDELGQVTSIKVGLRTAIPGRADANNLFTFSRQLREILGIAGTPYDQVLIRVAPALHYAELMKIIDMCTRQKMADGQLLQKISFIELGESDKK